MFDPMRLVGPAIAALLLTVGSAIAGPAVTPLVSPEWLEENLGAEDLLILDLRSVDEFDVAHVPGSNQTPYPGAWKTEREGIPSRIPLTADLEVMLSGIGIGANVAVVLVPAGTNSTEIGGATWIYWVLKYLGHDAVAILNGGWAAWERDDRATERGAVAGAEPRQFVAAPRPELLAETGYVADRLHSGTYIIDARPAPQYEGVAQSGLVTRPGHIPGAISLDNALFYDPLFNQFKEFQELETQLPAGLTDRSAEIISCCNAGHWGSISWFVLHELLGFENTRLYEGSMAAWSRTELPIVLGADPG
ncbi:MAG: sulfurtransferase [Alphaproteobacteria bacterium]